MIRYLTVTLLLLCTSCIQIGGEPAKVNYYLLQSNPKAEHIYSLDKFTIDIKIIDFPEYLDRKQIVTHGQDNRVQIAPSDNWAEPLQDNLLRVLRKNLNHLLPQAQIALNPWEHDRTGALKIDLLINDFSGKLEKETIVDINWTIRKNKQVIDQGRFYDDQPIGNSYNDMTIGLSQSVGKLGHTLAKKLITIQ